MLYFVDNEDNIVEEYIVKNYTFKKKEYNVIYLTLETDKGKISFSIGSDSRVDSQTAMDEIVKSIENNISISFFHERNYIYISSVDNISEGKVDSTLSYQASGRRTDFA